MDARLTLEKRIEAELKSYDGMMQISEIGRASCRERV